MEPNIPISIEQVHGGYIVRSLYDARGETIDRDNTRVIAEHEDLVEFLAVHFGQSECPLCGIPCQRRSEFPWNCAGSPPLVVCPKCRLVNIEGHPSSLWFSTQDPEVRDKLAERFEEMTTAEAISR